MPTCAVIGCLSNSKDNPEYHYHRLPRCPLARYRWLRALGPVRGHSAFVCSRHFAADAYSATDKILLSRTAVPTLCLPKPVEIATAQKLPANKAEHVCDYRKRLEVMKRKLDTVRNRIRALGRKHGEKEATSKEPPKGKLSTVLACRACLATDTRLFEIQEHDLEDVFIDLTGQTFSVQDGLPRHLCAFCYTQLSKFAEFREKCQRARDLLDQLGPFEIDEDDIRAIDRESNELTPKLTEVVVHKLDSNDAEIFLPQTLKVKTENKNKDVFHDSDSMDEQNVFESPIEEDPSNYEEEENEENGKIEVIFEDITSKTEIDEKNEEFFIVEIPTKATKTRSDQTKPIKRKMINDDDITSKTGTDEENEEFMVFEISTNPTKTTKTKPGNTNPRKRKIINDDDIPSKTDTGDKNEKTVAVEISTRTRKRKMINDDYYPVFDYAEFEKNNKVKIELLTLEQQKQEIEIKKQKESYLNSEHQCEMCGKGFNYEATLNNHMGYHDPAVGPYECEICHFRFPSAKVRIKHRDCHRLRFTCRECGFISRTKSQARRHYETHEGKVYKCRHCPLTFSRFSSSLNHARILHPAQGTACPHCGETFLSKLGVKHHIARAHRPNIQPILTCEVCDATFSCSEALDKHSSSVTEENHLTHKPCLVCGDMFENEGELATHAKEEHPPDQFKCEECNETFANPSSFAKHTRRKHLGERAFLGRRETKGRRGPAPGAPRAPRAAGIEGRAARAAGAVCEVCGKMTPNTTVLHYHQFIHMAKKPFPCPHCDKTFTTKNSRDWHINTHTQAKPYQCEMCPLAFNVPSNLRRHQNVIHLGQRRNSPCPICGKIFSAPQAVRLHVDTVHHHKPAPPRRPRNRPAKSASQ